MLRHAPCSGAEDSESQAVRQRRAPAQTAKSELLSPDPQGSSAVEHAPRRLGFQAFVTRIDDPHRTGKVSRSPCLAAKRRAKSSHSANPLPLVTPASAASQMLAAS